MARLTAVALSFLFFQQRDLTVPRSADEVVGAVSQNVKEFQDLLPDFVCDEKITSAAYEYGKVTKMKTVDSIFTAVQKSSPGPGNGRAAFTESREIVAIDGKATSRHARMPTLPTQFTGGFSGLLSMTFSPDNLQAQHYVLADKPAEDGNLLVQFTTKDGQQKLGSFLNGQSFLNKDAGRAWIDPRTMQVVRLERDFLNLPRNLTRLTNTVDYGPVTIGDRKFWMPRAVRIDSTERNVKKTGSYTATYSNCKRFVADIKILQ